ncbi:class E sortase [Glutamicibacter ectropisis]|uniref:Class E sortase n=1 Tax=Glutamicibacter ectropisis TaxID=3046593 RepID=A0AAU6WDX5_9MICC
MNRSATVQGRRIDRRPRSAGNIVVGFFGELFITLGIILMLYVAWELWWTNIDSAQAQKQATQSLVQELGDVVIPDESDDSAAEDDNKDYGPAPVTKIGPGETFGIMYFPRFGAHGSHHPVTNGVGDNVIDNLGIGHYPTTQQPGELGNFAVAAHRQTHGQVFWDIDKLQKGDKIYLQTSEGYYTYTWYATEIVDPSNGDVLLPTPHQWGVEPTKSILTMTTCHPKYTTQQRMIAYSELTDWRPLDAGPPKEIRDMVIDATS